MTLTYVEEVPVVERRGRHNLQNLIQEFINEDKDIARVDWTEKDYKNASVCRQCIYIEQLSCPVIRSRYSREVMKYT